ncbi:MAG: DUF2461 domain-containing protein [Myxococcales bacterium]|nr:DUF2461 domain-containing protein [Myxococcales bacterium]
MAARARANRAGHFGPGLFEFLRELKQNNEREWFKENQHRYEAEVKAPLLRFIGDLNDRLAPVSREFVADARPVGGSMFRIYRDTRFSKDKSPFKTAAAAHFPHRRCGKDVHAPGFYLHLEPGESCGGGGLWHPDAPSLKKVRDAFVKKSAEWKAIRSKVGKIEGETLKRPPPGYDPGHPFIEDLKRKDFYVMVPFSDREVCSADFLDRYVQSCRKCGPLVAFLTKAMGLAF